MWIVTKEAVTSIVRTGVTYVYALVLTQFPAVGSFLDSVDLNEQVFVVLVGTVTYAAIRAAAERWPNVGSLLVFNTKPTYKGI